MLNDLTEEAAREAGSDLLCDTCLSRAFPCEDCNGTGEVPAIGPEGGERDGYVPCPSCHHATT